MTCPSDLVAELDRHGVTLRLADDGRLKVRWNGQEPPTDAVPLLREVKARKDEVAAYLAGLTPFLPVQVAPGARPVYGPTDWELERRYLADERAGMKLLH